MPLFPIRLDSGRVFFHQFSKDHPLKYRENQHRQQIIHHGAIGRIGQQPDAQDIASRRAPHQTGQKQQGVPFDFHPQPPFE